MKQPAASADGEGLSHGDSAAPGPTPARPELKLWYRKPARDWFDCLPVGNGRLGAAVHGGINTERLGLNESTLWAGAPAEDDYNPKGGAEALKRIRELMLAGSYDDAWDMTDKTLRNQQDNFGTNVPAGDVLLTQAGLDGAIGDYLRVLDIDEAVVRTRFTSGGVPFERETFSSNPAGVLVTRLHADKGRLAFALAYNPGRLPCTIATEGNDTLIVSGRAYGQHAHAESGVMFHVIVRVIAEGGTVAAGPGGLTVSAADAATVLIAVNTNFGGADPIAAGKQQIAAAVKQSWTTLRAQHVADHQRLFRRVSLDLDGANKALLPTDVRRAVLSSDRPDPKLEALFFQYGRYLLIAGSRENSPLPTHLQGLWNDDVAANMAWTCDYHLNINMQQNYWPSEVTNLSECGEPLFRLVETLTRTGSTAARQIYGIDKGWVTHWSTNAWGAQPTGYGPWGFNVVAGVWIAQHLWDHYEFTGDRVFLADRAYPVLKGAAEFFLAYLFHDEKTGYLLSGPSGSPEQGFAGPSPTHDTAFITALFKECVAASETLSVDAEFRQRLSAALAQLPPYKIGKNGQIQEWLFHDEGGETNHRHTSHLVGLFPLDQITPQATPELAAAARESITLRMARADFEDIEWSRANAIAYYARLLDGDEAHAHLVTLIEKLTRSNLFSISVAGVASAVQEIFVVDGNEGGTAAMAEMLLQSHGGVVALLPALPRAWPAGSVSGLRARGGFEVDETWRNGVLATATIRSLNGGPCTLQYGDKTVRLETKPGGAYEFDGALKQRSRG